ncbi:hypothetical protein [Pseudoxanthomonas sp. CF385]|uniref:hypothetical protein n=1 Tax=Pseudoxanthomonas sp. CF385 TaxID=1881042 RepID=UPI001114642E|nr:hypothetical protein [Pseudoxanthomonas sp. CF385]
MKRFIAFLAMLVSISGTSCAQSTPPIDVAGLTEASMNFDQEGVGAFLDSLSQSFSSGFSSDQADKLAAAIEALPVEQTGNWEYGVTVNGKPERLVVVAFKDDIDAPDLAFYSSAELAARIQRQLESFAQAQGW